MQWTQTQTEYLIENYSNFGTIYCATQLKIAPIQVTYKATNLGLKLNKMGWHYVSTHKEHKLKTPAKCNVNPLQFINPTNPTNPESCYILGFLWADGCLGSAHHTINTEIISTDAEFLRPVFESTGKWNVF